MAGSIVSTSTAKIKTVLFFFLLFLSSSGNGPNILFCSKYLHAVKVCAYIEHINEP